MPATHLGPSVSGTETKFVDRVGVEHLAPERSVTMPSIAPCARRRWPPQRPLARADDQDVEDAFLESSSAHAPGPLSSLARLLELHATLAEVHAVEEERRHAHHLALCHFVLVDGAVDGDVLHVGVARRDQVQGLDQRRAVLHDCESTSRSERPLQRST